MGLRLLPLSRQEQLLHGCGGRSCGRGAGRADGDGRVLIQTFNVLHPALQWVKDHDVQAFYRHEIKYREFFAYPPFTRLIKVIFRHADEAKAVAGGTAMAAALATVPGIAVQGPGPAIIARVRNQFIQEIWIKCPRDNKLIESVKVFLKTQKQYIQGQRGNANVQIVFDVDPA